MQKKQNLAESKSHIFDKVNNFQENQNLPENKSRIFNQIDKMHEEQIQLAGKTSGDSETKKEEGWN